MKAKLRSARALGCAALTTAFFGGTEMSTSIAQAQNAPTPAAAASATPADIVDALKALAGNPLHARANFAKGQCVRGTYTPSREASRVTRSQSFTRPSSVLARFAVSGGNPHTPDTTKAALKGLALRLGPDDHRSELLVENAPVHFAKNLDQMLASLKSRTAGPDGKLDPEKFKTFGAANPEALNQSHFVGGKPLPASFAGTTYWGVHSFPATNAKGDTRFIKFKIVPVAGDLTLTDEEAKGKPADFLVQDLEKRIAEGAVKFDVLAILDRPGDPTMDVTVRWPDEDTRESVRLGTVAITAIEPNATCDENIFNPSNLADGIGHPPDPIFAARFPAYAISLGRRLTDKQP